MHFNLFALSALVLSAVLVCQAEAAKSTVHINNKDDYVGRAAVYIQSLW